LSSGLPVSHLEPQCATLSKHINVQLKTQILCWLVAHYSDTLKPQPTEAQEREKSARNCQCKIDELMSELTMIYPNKLFYGLNDLRS